MSIELFKKQRAVNVVVGGNYKLPNWYDPQGRLRKFACRTSRVSPFRMIVDAPVVGKLGDVVTSYFSDFGKLTGVIADTVAGSFLLEMKMAPNKRGKLSDQLTWLEQRQKDPRVTDSRKHARIIPVAPHSKVTMADGSTHGCFVIDASVSGVAVSSSIQPAVGTPLAVGACVGRVVRLLPDGFAVQFAEQQRRQDLEWLLSRPATQPEAARAAALDGPAPSETIEDASWLI